MSEKSKIAKAEKKQTNAKSEDPKTSNPQTEKSSKDGETKSQDSTGNSGEVANKSVAAKSASQKSISHFSSVSTPEYRAGWDKIFGESKLEQSPPEKLTKYDQRTALVSENGATTKKPKIRNILYFVENYPFWSSRGWRRNSQIASKAVITLPYEAQAKHGTGCTPLYM